MKTKQAASGGRIECAHCDAEAAELPEFAGSGVRAVRHSPDCPALWASWMAIDVRRADSDAAAMATHNAALPDSDPRKFTWADYDLWTGRNPEAQVVADKIKALLPPR